MKMMSHHPSHLPSAPSAPHPSPPSTVHHAYPGGHVVRASGSGSGSPPTYTLSHSHSYEHHPHGSHQQHSQHQHVQHQQQLRHPKYNYPPHQTHQGHPPHASHHSHRHAPPIEQSHSHPAPHQPSHQVSQHSPNSQTHKSYHSHQQSQPHDYYSYYNYHHNAPPPPPSTSYDKYEHEYEQRAQHPPHAHAQQYGPHEGKHEKQYEHVSHHHHHHRSQERQHPSPEHTRHEQQPHQHQQQQPHQQHPQPPRHPHEKHSHQHARQEDPNPPPQFTRPSRSKSSSPRGTSSVRRSASPRASPRTSPRELHAASPSHFAPAAHSNGYASGHASGRASGRAKDLTKHAPHASHNTHTTHAPISASVSSHSRSPSPSPRSSRRSRSSSISNQPVPPGNHRRYSPDRRYHRSENSSPPSLTIEKSYSSGSLHRKELQERHDQRDRQESQDRHDAPAREERQERQVSKEKKRRREKMDKGHPVHRSGVNDHSTHSPEEKRSTYPSIIRSKSHTDHSHRDNLDNGLDGIERSKSIDVDGRGNRREKKELTHGFSGKSGYGRSSVSALLIAAATSESMEEGNESSFVKSCMKLKFNKDVGGSGEAVDAVLERRSPTDNVDGPMEDREGIETTEGTENSDAMATDVHDADVIDAAHAVTNIVKGHLSKHSFNDKSSTSEVKDSVQELNPRKKSPSPSFSAGPLKKRMKLSDGVSPLTCLANEPISENLHQNACKSDVEAGRAATSQQGQEDNDQEQSKDKAIEISPKIEILEDLVEKPETKDQSPNKLSSSLNATKKSSNENTFIPNSKSSSIDTSTGNSGSGGIVILRHFPKLLHELLSKSNAGPGGNKDESIQLAMEWLPHGKGWRVLRWDSMCTDVLPNKFPELCDDIVGMNDIVEETTNEVTRDAGDGKDEAKNKNDDEGNEKSRDEKEDCDNGSPCKKGGKFSDEQWIDAFLWHVRAWGFKEVKTGRDRGSYQHQFFLRDAPELCDKMGHNPAPLSPSNNSDIGRSSSSLEGMAWRTSRTTASSIFKQKTLNEVNATDSDSKGALQSRTGSHPTYLHVPVLTSSTTAWGSESSGNHRLPTDSGRRVESSRSTDSVHFPRPYPPNNTSSSRGETKEVTRSPRIRFQEHSKSLLLPPRHSYDSRKVGVTPVEISPSAPPSSPPQEDSRGGHKTSYSSASFMSQKDYDVAQITPRPDQLSSKSESSPSRGYTKKIRFSASFGGEHSGHSKGHKHVSFPVSRRGGRGASGPLRPSLVSRRTTS